MKITEENKKELLEEVEKYNYQKVYYRGYLKKLYSLNFIF